MATGSSDDSRSILPEYREGYEVGKVERDGGSPGRQRT